MYFTLSFQPINEQKFVAKIAEKIFSNEISLKSQVKLGCLSKFACITFAQHCIYLGICSNCFSSTLVMSTDHESCENAAEHSKKNNQFASSRFYKPK